MEFSVKTYDELTKDEMYGILQLRSSVFVVEQACPYQDIDGKDKGAYHLCIRDGMELVGYLRIILGAESTAVIGRVISVRRRQGIATKMMEDAISFVRTKGVNRVVLEAQTYAEDLYLKNGFHRTGGPFMLDGIEHVAMEKTL